MHLLFSKHHILSALLVIQILLVGSKAQFFDAFTSGKEIITDGSDDFDERDGYGAPKPSYGAPSRPSYQAKPSYGGGGKGINFKQIEIPVPDIDLPNPLEFKAGVLRSKGRIASGLLHAKAGILRAGANILAQKANTLDKIAQAIPAVKAGIIQKFKNNDKGGGYGAPSSGYNAPQSGYNAPQQPSSYNAPQPPPSYNGGGGGGGGGLSLASTFSNNNFGGGGGGDLGGGYNGGNNNFGSGFGNNNNFNNFGSGDSYNSGGLNPGVVSNIPLQSSVSFNSGNNFNPNSVSAPDSYGSPLADPISSFDNNNQILTSSNFNNNNQIITGNSLDSYATNNNINSQLINNDVQNFGIDSGLTSSQNSPLTFNGNSNNNPFLGHNSLNEQLLLQESRLQAGNGGQCKTDRALSTLLSDIFMGNELIPDVLDRPPKYPLDLTYKTIRTYPGMKVTADVTKFKPMLHWPAEPDALYTVILSNLDINNRKNRTLAEFWHWFVANIPGDSLDEGEVVFDLLFPLVLPDGNGDHRFGYFVFKQPEALDYADEGGPTDACSPNMSNGRGPFKSTKNFAKKYNLELTAATFLIVNHSEASMTIACEWQKCIGDTINLVSPLRCGNDN